MLARFLIKLDCALRGYTGVSETVVDHDLVSSLLKEGEIRTMWRASGHRGFWFMSRNLALSRYYSRLLALQIKAVEVGLKK
jgi:hypothetical protein